MSKSNEVVKGTGLTGGITFRDVAREAIQAQTLKEDAKLAGDSMSDHFLLAAQTYSHGKNLKDEKARTKLVESLVSIIVAEEKFMKSENCPTVDRWDKIPPAWSQCKSNIKKGIEAGFNPSDYKTMSKYRKALNDFRKGNKPDEGEKATDQAQEVNASNPEIGQRMLALLAMVEGTTADQQAGVVEVLDKTLAEIKVLRQLVPTKPTKPMSAKEALANKPKASKKAATA